MFNVAMLVITGYNIGNSAGWFAISTGAIYAIGKKFVELAKAKGDAPTAPTVDLDKPHTDTAR